MATWSHGLCGCLDDCMLCLTTYVAPCYTIGKSAEAVGDDCLLCGLASFVPLANIWFGAQTRGKIRQQKGIDGTLINDLLMTCCCPICSVMQNAQEIGVKAPCGSQAMARQ